MESTTIAVDLAKHGFQAAVSDRPGHVALERRLTRARLRGFFAHQPAATMVMEACGSAITGLANSSSVGSSASLA